MKPGRVATCQTARRALEKIADSLHVHADRAIATQSKRAKVENNLVRELSVERQLPEAGAPTSAWRVQEVHAHMAIAKEEEQTAAAHVQASEAGLLGALAKLDACREAAKAASASVE